jgi:hypothetical protein
MRELFMDKQTIKNALPTISHFWEKRQAAKKNQLPKHLRPLPRWPIVIQIALNLGIIVTLSTLMLNRDDYLTEAGPAIGLVLSLLFLIYTLISALQLRQRYKKAPGYRWTQVNLWLMIVAAILFPIGVACFLP